MQHNQNRKIVYTAVSLGAIILHLALMVFGEHIDSDPFGSLFTIGWQLHIWSPLTVSIMYFIKILLQKEMGASYSRIINILATLILLCGMLLFRVNPYARPLMFVMYYPITTIVFCLQLSSLIYDLFSRRGGKEQKDSQPCEKDETEHDKGELRL